MSSDDTAIKRREVRKVTMEFTDSYADDGTPGLIVTAKFEPEDIDLDDLTISQKWGQHVLETILSHSTVSEIIDTEVEDSYNLPKKPDPNSQLN